MDDTMNNYFSLHTVKTVFEIIQGTYFGKCLVYLKGVDVIV